MDDSNSFELHIKSAYEKYYGAEKSYGIYAVNVEYDSPNQDEVDEICDFNREINMVGSMPRLKEGSIYVAKLKHTRHPQYGKQYEVVSIYKKPFSSREEQVTFLGTLISSNQLEKICTAYPTENIVELIEQDKLDPSLIKGVGEKTISKIKDKIADNKKYESAIIELNGNFGINYNAIKRLSDKYGSPDLLIQKINENPYLLTEVDGYGFKKVDEIALQMGVEKKSKNRIQSCVEYILDENANSGHAWVKRTKLISQAIKLLGVKISDVQEILDIIEERDFTVLDDKVYMNKYWEYENGIARHIHRLLGSKVEYKVENIEEVIKEIEGNQGFQFTEEQKKAIYYAVEYNVIVVNGKAGTGKTAVIKGIIGVLNKVSGIEYATCALSGKASQRIQESTGLDSSTMHRLLGYNPNLGWTYNEEAPLGHDVIMLDEVSMVNSQLFYYLCRAIKDGGKLIVSGDVAQLEPIGVGNVLVDLLASNKVPKVELTIVHRQAQMSGILSNANMVREGRKFLSDSDYKNQRLGELKDLYMYPYKESKKVYESILQISKKYDGDIMDFQVLTPMKNRGDISTRNINRELQLIFNQDPTYVDKKKKIERTIDRKKVTFLEGDKVIINGNHPDKGVFNGTMGIIEYIDSVGEGQIVIEFESVGRIMFKKDEMKSIDLGYCISIHKSQGSQWKYVLLALDYSSYVLLNRQSTYTGMTRAVEALFFCVELKALQFSIETDKSSQRNTFLKDLL